MENGAFVSLFSTKMRGRYLFSIFSPVIPVLLLSFLRRRDPVDDEISKKILNLMFSYGKLTLWLCLVRKTR